MERNNILTLKNLVMKLGATTKYFQNKHQIDFEKINLNLNSHAGQKLFKGKSNFELIIRILYSTNSF